MIRLTHAWLVFCLVINKKLSYLQKEIIKQSLTMDVLPQTQPL